MNAISMMQTAVWLLAIAAGGGLVMAFVRFSRKVNPPAWLSMLHGFLIAAAFAILVYAWCTVGLPSMAKFALALFAIAAAGGVLMNLGYREKQRLIPSALVIGHAVLAVAGIGLLVLAAFGN